VGTNDWMVVASADVTNPGAAAEKQYLFTITRNNINPGTNGTADATVEDSRIDFVCVDRD